MGNATLCIYTDHFINVLICIRAPESALINYFYYATTVKVPAAVPIPAALVIVALVVVPLSLIVPLFNAKQFAPNDNTSSSFVAALAAPITNENTNSLLPVPEAYANAC